jgi:biopolymer transport protein ExbD
MSLSQHPHAEPPPKVEINIVPLVDVALVLLIIFMVTATFVKTTGMQLELPSSATTRAVEAAPREISIGITPTGAFLWQDQAVTDAQLASALSAEAQRHGTDHRVTIYGDTHAEHGRVVQAMTLAQQAGFAHLVIATRQGGRRHAQPK